MIEKQIPTYLVSIVHDYLKDRTLVTTQNDIYVPMTRGVPRGLVLGPLLWNIMYNTLLRLDMPPGIMLVGFANDLGLVAVAETKQQIEDSANVTLACVTQ